VFASLTQQINYNYMYKHIFLNDRQIEKHFITAFKVLDEI